MDSELIPVEVDVDSELIELVADDRPVDVEVDSEATLLFVVLNPVESELILLVVPETVVERLSTARLVANN
ncbi:ATPase [Burkholderia territorii]|nr:ATPase [Burkholderia territorii]